MQFPRQQQCNSKREWRCAMRNRFKNYYARLPIICDIIFCSKYVQLSNCGNCNWFLMTAIDTTTDTPIHRTIWNRMHFYLCAAPLYGTRMHPTTQRSLIFIWPSLKPTNPYPLIRNYFGNCPREGLPLILHSIDLLNYLLSNSSVGLLKNDSSAWRLDSRRGITGRHSTWPIVPPEFVIGKVMDIIGKQFTPKINLTH